MPANVIKSWSKKHKVDPRTLKKRWDRAEKQAGKQGHKKNYAYRMAIFKKMTQKFRRKNKNEEFNVGRNLISEEIPLRGSLQVIGAAGAAAIVNAIYKIRTGKFADFYATIVAYLGGKLAGTLISKIIEKLRPSVEIKRLAREYALAKARGDKQKARDKEKELEQLIKEQENLKAAGAEADKIIKRLKSKTKNEEYIMNNTQELRNFIQEEIELSEDMKVIKDELREDIEEMTTSSNIDISPPGKLPAGSDFKKDKLPGERDKAKHKVKDDEVEDIEDTDNSERTGYSGIQPGNADKKPIGEDEELSDEDLTEEELSEEELIEMVDNMTEEEFNEFANSLDDDEAEALEEILKSKMSDEELEEAEEVLPDEIDASHPPKMGSNAGLNAKSVDSDLDTPQKKTHVAKQVDIMGDGNDVGNVPESKKETKELSLLESAVDSVKKKAVNEINSLVESVLNENPDLKEKWEKEVEIKSTGEHADKTIEQLKKEVEALRGKPGNKEKMGELLFAIRAKQGWKKGEGSTGLSKE